MNKFVNAQEDKYFNAFNLIEGIGPVTFKKLRKYFQSLSLAWSAEKKELEAAGLSEGLSLKIKKEQKEIDPDWQMAKLEKAGIDLITLLDENYPRLLKEIYAPPAMLYLRGHLLNKEPCLAIVGTRKISDYGRRITPDLARDLADAGLTIVSGLAKGIDTLAHQAVLKSSGRTIAVLGSGLDRESIYPKVNQELAEQIIQQGAIISEFPLGSQPLAQNFPQRNRIIAGLSLGILVIEAPERSGALITANDALEQNRDIFAVPGPIWAENSLGPHSLIKMGAKLVNQAEDVLNELNYR